jgi:hypothetical protein
VLRWIEHYQVKLNESRNSVKLKNGKRHAFDK